MAPQDRDTASPDRHQPRQGKGGGNKRKRKWEDARIQHGSRKHRGDKKQNLGRKGFDKTLLDKRDRNDAEQEKRRRLNIENNSNSQKPSVLPQAFPKDEVAAEERRPKRKVAVLLGYSGSGYHGMQINSTEKTIEGDLFTAFVKAGAISKANADDPKKSALVRCARTDKGVHAAGNVISLKLIVEDEDIVDKINAELTPQIRIWGIERTVGSFSCYQACDSRWYEYLIPSHSFLPPWPHSFLGKKLVEIAEEVGDKETYAQRQDEVSSWWAEVENAHIQPILDSLEPDVAVEAKKALYTLDDGDDGDAEEAAVPVSEIMGTEPDAEITSGEVFEEPKKKSVLRQQTDAAAKRIRQAIIAAKRAYRISPKRLDRVREALKMYEGTHNFHNYTIKKNFKDPSAQRLIKSFVVSDHSPIVIDNTEWLSLRIHGQSFMMHQIRKMVSLLTLVVRCGCSLERITESYSNRVVPIPRAPGLGLLLERPVFDSYNARVTQRFDKEKIDFEKHAERIEAFKREKIYRHIFDEEERENTFHSFFGNLDKFKDQSFLWLTSKGMRALPQAASGAGSGTAVSKAVAIANAFDQESGDEEAADEKEEG